MLRKKQTNNNFLKITQNNCTPCVCFLKFFISLFFFFWGSTVYVPDIILLLRFRKLVFEKTVRKPFGQRLNSMLFLFNLPSVTHRKTLHVTLYSEFYWLSKSSFKFYFLLILTTHSTLWVNNAKYIVISKCGGHKMQLLCYNLCQIIWYSPWCYRKSMCAEINVNLSS